MWAMGEKIDPGEGERWSRACEGVGGGGEREQLVVNETL